MRIAKFPSIGFEVDQACLTGEGMSVPKSVEVVQDPNAVISGKSNMLFSGTFVCSGTAIGIVVQTGKLLERNFS
jgi:Ca2+ transporting ATPase